jgi:hypothetical protein
MSAPQGTQAFGIAVHSAGHVNGDGFGDLAVGANSPQVYVYLGSASGIATSPAPAYALSGLANGGGQAIAGADVNGDGYSDLLVGSYQAGGLDGLANVYLGGPGGLSTTAIPLDDPVAGTGAAFGSEIGVADVNGDGYADALVSAYRQQDLLGGAYLFLGGPGGLSKVPATVVSPTPPTAMQPAFGVGLGAVGDIDGDGYDDMVVGAYVFGTVYFYAGGPGGLSTSPIVVTAPAGGYFGNAIAGGGDVDGDGYPDFVIGAEGVNSYVGAAYWFHGGPTWFANTPAPLVNPNPETGVFGWAVAM